MTGLYWRLQSI